MNPTDFDTLVASIQEAGAIRRGEKSTRGPFEGRTEDARGIRERLGLTQAEFAQLIGVSPSTLRKWEMGLKAPEGPARALLKVAAAYPEAVVSALAE